MILKSTDDVIKRFPFATLSTSQLQMLLATYLVFEFILPPIDKQGAKRSQYIDIALVGILVGQIINLIPEVAFLLKVTKPELKHLHAWIKTEDVQRRMYLALRYLRSSAIEIGFTLDFFNTLNGLSSDDASTNGLGNLYQWLTQQSSWTRLGIIAPLILGKTAFDYFTLKKELESQPAPDPRQLLLWGYPQLNDRKLNPWALLRFWTNLPLAFMLSFVVSSKRIELVLAFLQKAPSMEIIRAGIYTSAALLTLRKFIPDHPHFYYISPLNRIARFADKFIEHRDLMAITLFSAIMDAIAYVEGKQIITVNNNTALLILTSILISTTLLAEVLYKLATVLNETNGSINDTMYGNEVFSKNAISLYWWLASANGNPWVSIPALLVGTSSFYLPETFYKRQYNHSNFQKIAKHINLSLLNSSMLLHLTPAANLMMLAKLGLSVVIAIPYFLSLHFLPRKSPLIKPSLKFAELCLLSINTYNSVMAFLKPFEITSPASLAYSSLSFPLLTFGFASLKRVVSDKQSLGNAAKNSLKDLANLSRLRKTLTFFVAMGMLFETAAAMNTSKTIAIGVIPALITTIITGLMLHLSSRQDKGNFFDCCARHFGLTRRQDISLPQLITEHAPPTDESPLLSY